MLIRDRPAQIGVCWEFREFENWKLTWTFLCNKGARGRWLVVYPSLPPVCVLLVVKGFFCSLFCSSESDYWVHLAPQKPPQTLILYCPGATGHRVSNHRAQSIFYTTPAVTSGIAVLPRSSNSCQQLWGVYAKRVCVWERVCAEQREGLTFSGQSREGTGICGCICTVRSSVFVLICVCGFEVDVWSEQGGSGLWNGGTRLKEGYDHSAV